MRFDHGPVFDGLRQNLQWRFDAEAQQQLDQEIQDILSRVECVEDNKPGSGYEFDPTLLEEMMKDADLHIFFTDFFDALDLNKRLKKLVEKGLLFCKFNREVFSSGYDWECTRQILVNEPLFEQYLQQTEEKFDVGTG